MNRAGHQLLSGAGLAGDKYRHIGRSDLMNLFDQSGHCRAGMNEARHQACTGKPAILFDSLAWWLSGPQSADVHAEFNDAQQRIERKSSGKPCMIPWGNKKCDRQCMVRLKRDESCIVFPGKPFACRVVADRCDFMGDGDRCALVEACGDYDSLPPVFIRLKDDHASSL